MGVITTAYSIPPKMMRKIKANHDNLAYILGLSEEENPAWKVEDYDFDKSFEDTVCVLRACGYRKTYKHLDLESYFYSGDENKYFDYEGYDISLIAPAVVKTIIKELEHVTFEELKTKGLANEATDWNGQIIPASYYAHYVGDIEDIKQFFKRAAEQGHYLLFAVA